MAGKLFPALNGFLGGQLVLLLFLFLFEQLQFLPVKLVFILLATFITHLLSRFLVYCLTGLWGGSLILARIHP